MALFPSTTPKKNNKKLLKSRKLPTLLIVEVANLEAAKLAHLEKIES
jgi:hypothetical protein